MKQILSTVGTGYTEATVIHLLGEDKFIGYVPTKNEYIMATFFSNESYGHTTYGHNLSDLLKLWEHRQRDNSEQSHLERLDSDLSNHIDDMSYYDTNEQFLDLIEVMEDMRGVIND